LRWEQLPFEIDVVLTCVFAEVICFRVFDIGFDLTTSGREIDLAVHYTIEMEVLRRHFFWYIKTYYIKVATCER
jgi:hypothetical protein